MNPTSTVTPGLIVKSASRALAFYQAVFGAVEQFRLTEPGGKIGHAEFRIGDSLLTIADEYPDFGALSPLSIGGTPVSLHLYVEDADAVIALAIAEGATLLRPAADEFYGDRCGVVLDPFGHKWQIATRKESVSPEEMQRRFGAMLSG